MAPSSVPVPVAVTPRGVSPPLSKPRVDMRPASADRDGKADDEDDEPDASAIDTAGET